MKVQDCVHLQGDNWAVVSASVTGEIWNGALSIVSFKDSKLKQESEWAYELGALTSVAKVVFEDKSISIYCGAFTGEILGFNLPANTWALNTPEFYTFHSAPILTLASYQNCLISGGYDNKINLYTASPSELVLASSVVAHYKSVLSLTWIDQTNFISSSEDHDVKFWRIEQAKEKNIISTKPYKVITLQYPIFSISVSSLGNYLALGQEEGVTVYINPCDEKSSFCTISNPMAPVKRVAFRPVKEGMSNVLLIGTDDARVKAFELNADQPPKEIETRAKHSDFVRSLCWSSDGQSYMSGGWSELDDEAALDLVVEKF
jgi:WD40 repeat protein